jgi:hypothetical protein
MISFRTVTVDTTGLTLEEIGGAVDNAIREMDCSVRAEVLDVTITPIAARYDTSEDWRPNFVTELGCLLLFKLDGGE